MGNARLPPEATQPAADKLLDSAAVSRAAERLTANPRVTRLTIGRSAGGRPIEMLAITAPGGPLDGWQRRAQRISGPAVRYTTLEQASRDEPSLDELLPATRLPVLLAGASWGHEAAQVEGLLAAAEYLAADPSPATGRLLSRIVVLIIPLMNPDGRDRAIAEWTRTPLSNGDAAVGNANGLMLNRDFVHQTQPETQAVLRVVREWRPVVGIDLHEDVSRLGLAVPEIAFAPPYMPGFDVEEDPSMRRALTKVGDAIADRWKRAGYAVVHDPAGDRRWVPLPSRGSGELNPVAGSSGRLEFLFNIHSVVGLITESARTPGTQTWEARVDQKKLAALAAAEAVAADPAYFARTVLERRAAAARPSPGAPRFLAIPHAQPAGADRTELLRLLRDHDVLVYRAVGLPFDVVPLAQPEQPFIRHALLADRSKLNDLGAALGVAISSSAVLPAATRRRLIAAPLQLYEPASIAWPQAARQVSVGVYTGQGVDGSASGEVQFVLRMAGLSPGALGEDEIRAGKFGGVSAIVFGDGAAREIVDGWDLSAPTRKPPWQPASPSRGIGREGVEAIRAFVRAGGRVVTIGRSAGLVVPGLLSLQLLPDRPGIGEVRLRIAQGGRALFAGTPWGGNEARAFLFAPPGGRDGGYLFASVPPSQVIAWYTGAIGRPDEQSFAETASLSAARRRPAIVSTMVGKGRVTVFGFSPVFRAQWRATFPLLFNAIGAGMPERGRAPARATRNAGGHDRHIGNQ